MTAAGHCGIRDSSVDDQVDRRKEHDDGREDGDFFKEAVATVAARLMDAEITAEVGAARGEVCAERSTCRTGYRSRP